MPLAPSTIRKIIKELTKLSSNPPEDIRVKVDEEDVLAFEGIIAGPEGTPYHGGYFRVRFTFGDEFPAAPPKCRFTTRIFHPNVSPSGEICVNTLKKDWSPAYGITHILTVIKCLLIYPNPDSALDEEAGRLVREDWAAFLKRANIMTQVHAMREGKPEEFNDAKSEEEPLSASILDPSSARDPVFPTPSQPTQSASGSSGTSRPRIIRQRSRQSEEGNVVLDTPSTAEGPSTGVSTSVSTALALAVPLQNSAQSNGAPPRASPAPEKDSAEKFVVDKSLGGKVAAKEMTSLAKRKGLEKEVKTTGVGKTLKRPASSVVTGGAEKRKRGLKRL